MQPTHPDQELSIKFDHHREHKNLWSRVVYLGSYLSEPFLQKLPGEKYITGKFFITYPFLMLIAFMTQSMLAWVVAACFGIMEIWNTPRGKRSDKEEPHPLSDGEPRFGWLAPRYMPEEFKFFVQPFIVLVASGVLSYFNPWLGACYSFSGVCMLGRHMGFLELQAIRLEVLQDEQAAMERRIERLNQQLRANPSGESGI